MSVPVLPIKSARDYDENVARAAASIEAGELVVLPTETVYGAAGLLTSASALAALKGLRGAAPAGPFTVHVPDPEDARQYVGEVSEMAGRMMRKLWPGPVGLTFEVPATRRSEVAATLGLDEAEIYDPAGTITLRCPSDVVARDVLSRVDGPVAIAAPWAAPAGANVRSPAAELAEQLDGKVQWVVDGGPTRYAQPSTLLKVGPDGYQIVRKGVYDERIVERLMRTTILFVCSGNTCRSPMAEALARHLLAEANGVPEAELERKGINVISAGAYAMPGSRATPQAVDAVRTLGGDLSTHRSRQLTPELIHQADVIYTMGQGHAMAVAAMSPSARRKLTAIDPAGDVEDPIGSDVAVYRSLAGELKQLIGTRLNEADLLRPR